MKDLVIGCITGYDFDKIKPWVNSLDRCGFTGTKAMICYNVGYDTLEELVKRLSIRAEQQGRTDDTEEVIRHRQQVYLEQTQPIIEIYQTRGIVVEIDALGQVSEVTERILNALTTRGLSPAR